MNIDMHWRGNGYYIGKVLVGLGVMFLAVSECQASLVATDFNTDGTDVGFTGGWDGTTYVGIIDHSDLTYANYSITQTGTTQKVLAEWVGADRQDVRALASPASGTIWFSVLMHVPAGGDNALLTFNNNGTLWDTTTTDARILLQGGVIKVGFNGGTLSEGTGGFAVDTTHLILGQMNVGAGDDMLNIWVDPDLTAIHKPSALPATDFSNTATNFCDSITSIGAGGQDGSAAEVYVDAIWLSDGPDAFYDVTGCTKPPAGTVLYVR